jgi:hypothetical protein
VPHGLVINNKIMSQIGRDERTVPQGLGHVLFTAEHSAMKSQSVIVCHVLLLRAGHGVVVLALTHEVTQPIDAPLVLTVPARQRVQLLARLTEVETFLSLISSQ